MERLKSDFARQKASSLYWERWAYLHALKEIELLALRRTKGLFIGQFAMLQKKYPEEWDAIWKELNPDAYKKLNEGRK